MVIKVLLVRTICSRVTHARTFLVVPLLKGVARQARRIRDHPQCMSKRLKKMQRTILQQTSYSTRNGINLWINRLLAITRQKPKTCSSNSHLIFNSNNSNRTSNMFNNNFTMTQTDRTISILMLIEVKILNNNFSEILMTRRISQGVFVFKSFL